MSPYKVRDDLFVWWLGFPSTPRLVGALNLIHSLRACSLQYDPSWLKAGFALSEDLPLIAGQEFLPVEKDSAVGAIDDARPDRWGERVIRAIDRPPRLSVLEFLYFAGDERFGALGISTSPREYLPHPIGPLPELADTEAIYALTRQVIDGSLSKQLDERQQRLLAPGVTLGGARPKALIEIEGQPWVVKFSDGDPIDVGLVEHATMTLARLAGVNAAMTHPIALSDGHALAVKRFDRVGSLRVHALSAKTLLAARSEAFGYPQLAQWLRSRGTVSKEGSLDARPELFKRMVFNILIDNTNDHEKNHVVIGDHEQGYRLSPAFDVLPSGQALGFQQMLVGDRGADSTLENALSQCNQFGLKKDQATQLARQVIKVVDQWQAHFRDCGVTTKDIDYLADHIDRPFLKEQRNLL